MGHLRKRPQLLGAVCVVAAIVAGGALPVLLGAGATASSLGLGHAAVASCSPPAGSLAPVAEASPPCTPKLTAKPHSGLRNGQNIKVTGSGFASDDFVTLIECQSGATGECDFNGSESSVQTDASGAFTTTVPVSRLIEPETTIVDCATPGACVLAAFSYDSGDIGATTPIAFKNVPLPSLVASPATGLADGQTITVTGSHFPRGSQPTLTECPAGATLLYECDTDVTQGVTVGPKGTFTTSFDVARILATNEIEPGGGDIDCAQAPGCVLAAAGNTEEFTEASTPLAFDPSIPPQPPLNVSLVLASSGQVNTSGGAVLSGTISCTSSQPVSVGVEVSLAQTSFGLSADSTTTAQPTCTATPVPVTVTVPDESVPFSAGIAEVTLQLSARNGSAVNQQLLSGAISLSVPSNQPPPHFYVALGDAIAGSGSLPTDPGYVNDIEAKIGTTVPDLELVDLSCFDETSTSMIQGGDCAYPAGSQLAAADAFIAAHKAAVALVTIDIGGADFLVCLDGESVDPQCITDTNSLMSSNLTTIVTHLRSAAGSSVPIVGMNYFDPFLDYWPGGGSGRAIAEESVSILGSINSVMATVYADQSVPMADVSGAFETTDLSHKVKTSFGRVPVAVANTCNWLDFTCAKGRAGYGEDTDAAGAAVVAGAFEAVFPPSLSAGAKKRR
jgi:hypothetical protein